MTKKSVVIDYGIGNVFSVMQALKRNDCDARLTNDSQEILNADRVILPGVGAFGRAAEKLRTMGLDDVIHSYIEQERPLCRHAASDGERVGIWRACGAWSFQRNR